MIRYLIGILSILLLTRETVSSQEHARHLSFNGYLSTMQSVMFDSVSGVFANENLIHNRLNFNGYLNENITFAAESGTVFSPAIW